MGKSGHVARKIAATLASTGTPAHFVHPAEASHGDLGMVTKDDVALMLSNSGETPELMSLIDYTRRNGIPMIAIASKPESTLMKAADVALPLPAAPEACPMGLAPTTSTTATLALGDALAVALMGRREFGPEHYKMLHPGGTLGAKLQKISAVMRKAAELPLVAPETPMVDVLLAIGKYGLGVAGVVEEGALVGVISDGDVSRNIEGLREKTARDIMTTSPKTITGEARLQEAVDLMNRHKITMLFVIEDAQPVGAIHIHDCLRAGVS
jgi:arabinose-5-phosphate isomerase